MERLQTDEKFAEGFASFLKNQQERKNARPEEMKNYFDKNLQQAAFSSQMLNEADKLGIKLKDATEKQSGDLAQPFKTSPRT